MVDQPFLPQGESLAHLAQDLGLGHPNVVQVDEMLLGPRRTSPDADGIKGHPRSGIVDDEHGYAAPLTPFRVGDCLQQDKVGGRRPGYKHLGAVYHPVVPILYRPGLHHPAGVGPRLGFGLSKSVLQVPLDRWVQVTLLLLRGAGPNHHHRHG